MPLNIKKDFKNPREYSDSETLSILNEFLAWVDTSQLPSKTKHDVKKILEILRWIKINHQNIKTFVDNKEQYLAQLPLNDRKNGVLRDHFGTSIHFNSYPSGEKAVKELLSLVESFERIFQEWKDTHELLLLMFAAKCDYDKDRGCMEARVAEPMVFAGRMQTQLSDNHLAIPLEDLIKICQLLYFINIEENVLNFVLADEFLSDHYGKMVLYQNDKRPLSQELLFSTMSDILSLSRPSEEQFIYAKQLKTSNALQWRVNIFNQFAQNAIVVKGKQGMIQFRFDKDDDAQKFTSWLRRSECLQEYDIARCRVKDENYGREELRKYVVRLMPLQLEQMLGEAYFLNLMRELSKNPATVMDYKTLMGPIFCTFSLLETLEKLNDLKQWVETASVETIDDALVIQDSRGYSRLQLAAQLSFDEFSHLVAIASPTALKQSLNLQDSRSRAWFEQQIASITSRHEFEVWCRLFLKISGLTEAWPQDKAVTDLKTLIQTVAELQDDSELFIGRTLLVYLYQYERSHLPVNSSDDSIPINTQITLGNGRTLDLSHRDAAEHIKSAGLGSNEALFTLKNYCAKFNQEELKRVIDVLERYEGHLKLQSHIWNIEQELMDGHLLTKIFTGRRADAWENFIKQLKEPSYRAPLRKPLPENYKPSYKYYHLEDQVRPYPEKITADKPQHKTHAKKQSTTLISQLKCTPLFGSSNIQFQQEGLVGAMLVADPNLDPKVYDTHRSKIKMLLRKSSLTFEREWVGRKDAVDLYASKVKSISCTSLDEFKSAIKFETEYTNEVLAEPSKDSLLGIVMGKNSQTAINKAKQFQQDIQTHLGIALPIIFYDANERVLVEDFDLYLLTKAANLQPLTQLLKAIDSKQYELIKNTLEKEISRFANISGYNYALSYIFKHLSPEKIAVLCRILNYEPKLDEQNLYQFCELISSLEPEQIKAVCSSIKKHISTAIADINGFTPILKMICSEKRGVFIEFVIGLDYLKELMAKECNFFVGIFKYLTPTQQTEIYSHIIDDLPKFIRSALDIGPILNALDDTRRKETLELTKDKLLIIMRSVEDFPSVLYDLSEQERHYLINCFGGVTRLKKMINTSYHFYLITRYLPEDLIEQLVDSIGIKKLRQLIFKSPSNFINPIISALSAEQIDAVFKDSDSYWIKRFILPCLTYENLVKLLEQFEQHYFTESVSDFIVIFSRLSKKDASALFKHFKDIVCLSIKSIEDLSRVADYLLPECYTLLFEQLESKFRDMIKSVHDYTRLLKFLRLIKQNGDEWLYHLMENKLPTLSNHASQFGVLLNTIPLRYLRTVFSAIVAEKPAVVDVANIQFIYQYMDKDRVATIFPCIIDNQLKNQTMPIDFLSILLKLARDQINLILEPIKQGHWRIRIDETNLHDLLICFNNEALKNLLFNQVKDQFQKAIKYIKDFSSVAKKLDPQQLLEFCHLMKPHLPRLIKSAEEMKSLETLPDDKRDIVFDALVYEFPQLLSVVEDEYRHSFIEAQTEPRKKIITSGSLLRNEYLTLDKVKEIVREDGLLLQCAKGFIGANLEVVMQAYHHNPQALDIFSNDLKSALKDYIDNHMSAPNSVDWTQLQTTQEYKKLQAHLNLERYISIREKENHALQYPRRFLSLFSSQSSFSYKNKLDAAKRCIVLLQNPEDNCLTKEQLKAVQDGRLKSIIDPVKDLLRGPTRDLQSP